MAGVKPFELMYQVNANGMLSDQVLVSDSNTVSLLICPLDYGMTSGTIDIMPISLADANVLFHFPLSRFTDYCSSSHYIDDFRCPLSGSISFSEWSGV
jgi:hypothetical protein